ncbi:4-(cytidine 5'-diphospho)-2-C-methyl-D-erythritol kinase [Gleimia coleocanis]|uniref:4-(cytidine 5'-diphospho)-2-C-methyl-D-erythritol kinase n=1 Tax=Gleimia coleocanis TaxID=103618 RepID=UPI0003163ADF|nr:4-(cytidine 5'-diphospho)-2-C-methyl-D-erythritol kinase [Gleimia coleocanis]
MAVLRAFPEGGLDNFSAEIAFTPSGYPVRVRNKADLGEAEANRIAEAALADVEVATHLAFKAASLLVELAGERGCLPNGYYLDLTVIKRIPIAGGMAGGSADAAATLVAVNELLGLDLDSSALEVLGRRLGADVPACLTGGVSLGLGYGDHMTRLDKDISNELAGTRHWVMLMSATGLSTPAVFTAFDTSDRGRSEIPLPTQTHDILEADENLKTALGTAAEIAEILENDLQATAFTLRLDLAETYRAAKETDALNVVLSGSGPTIAMLAQTQAHATALAKKMQNHPNVVATLITSGPGLPAGVE